MTDEERVEYEIQKLKSMVDMLPEGEAKEEARDDRVSSLLQGEAPRGEGGTGGCEANRCSDRGGKAMEGTHG